jgi:hypothetical protein
VRRLGFVESCRVAISGCEANSRRRKYAIWPEYSIDLFNDIQLFYQRI